MSHRCQKAVGVATLLIIGVTALIAQVTIVTEDVAGVTNFRHVPTVVACAGATSPEALPAIKKMGFVSVVNLRQSFETGANVEAEAVAAQAAGLKYIHIPMNGVAPEPEAFDRFIEASSSPANQPMFVHCASGNRASAAWMAKRVLVDSWSLERASSEAEALGLRSEPLKAATVEYIKSRQAK